jgi:cellulose synthase/poly-beta-1,6-N-acetylglucosamine synthase-like glycosyltransferase
VIGVSFVVPVCNGAMFVRQTLESIFAQADGRPLEVVVVDDDSSDASAAILSEIEACWPLVRVPGPGRGAAAALNAGIRAARFPIICQVDQDVVLHHGWMQHVVGELQDSRVAAAQGYFAAEPHASLLVRVMGWDLEQRYAAIGGRTDHVCTGNSAYRAEALYEVGLFDEALGYGYDNDMSYRLLTAGYRLTLCREARSIHHWREGLVGYLKQQYGFGYGRLDLVAKHVSRVGGDMVSPPAMMLHPVLTLVGLIGLLGGLMASNIGIPAWSAYLGAFAIFAGLAVERLVAGISAAWRFRTLAPLMFPFVHLARNFAWVAAILKWSFRRLRRTPSNPGHSMYPRPRGNVQPSEQAKTVAPTWTVPDAGVVRRLKG